jgi:hypothetical protein
VSIAFLVLADRAELLLPRLLLILLLLRLLLILLLLRLLLILLLLRLPLVALLVVRLPLVRFPLLVVLLRPIVEEEDFLGISRLAQHNI